MSGHLETVKLTLHVLSPVHVGTRERQLSSIEAVPYGGRIYVVHDDRLGRFLAERRLVDAFVLAVTRDGGRFDLRTFLEERRLLSHVMLRSVSKYWAEAPEGIPLAQQAAFRPLIRGALGQPFIPGSSIKGAIRGALLNRRIAAMDQSQQERIWQDIEQQIQRRAKRERFAEPVTGRVLRGQLPLGRRNPRNVTGPNLDLLRCLKVSDCVYDGDTVVLPVQVLSLQRGDDRYYLKSQMLLECIPEKSKLSCTLTLDLKLLDEFRNAGTPLPFSSLRELLGLVQEHAEHLLDEEYDFFDGLEGAETLAGFYDQTDANLRIGFGSGLLGTSILPNLSKDQRFRLRDTVLTARRDSNFFPKSRKVVTNGRKLVAPLGWVRWEVTG